VESSRKAAGPDVPRIRPPEETLAALRPVVDAVGITRVAQLTGLDRIGIPVCAVVRPNSRSYAVSQGKGITPEAAKASGLMEAIENYHAEEATIPLRFGRSDDLRHSFSLPDVAGLPRLRTSTFSTQAPILWAEGGVNLVDDTPMLLPHDLVHLDFRVPRPHSPSFLVSSNGLASGNHLFEAISHGLCEVIERDANTLWRLGGERVQRARRLDLTTVDDPSCIALLRRFEGAEIDVIAWDTTSDVGVPSVLCDVVDRFGDVARPMPAICGSGSHPSRRIALARALTEAAQGRLTRISGSRDDLFGQVFDDSEARRMAAATRALFLSHPPAVSFLDMPTAEHETVEEDVRWICDALQAAGFHQILVLDLTRPDLQIPVVRIVVPYLEAMSEVPGYVPGKRGRFAMEQAT
jgi:YcaO-like protein with predicted kinase domain